MNKSKLILIIF